MIRDEDLPELRRFRIAEGNIPIHEDPSFGSLVVANEGEDVPVHRWFRLKESFSPRLLNTVLSHIYPNRPASLSLLDPFAGVGTTLISAQLLPHITINATGIERNPFIAFAAKTKLRWHEIDPTQFLADGQRVLESTADHSSAAIPVLSSISTGRCISLHKTRKLITIRDAIIRANLGARGDALLLGLAAAIEPLSRIRRDGRALRIVERQCAQVVPTLMAQ